MGQAAPERRTRKRRAPVTVRGLEREVERLATEVKKDREATTTLGVRIDTLNLNGSAVALKRLADETDRLLKLADVSGYIVEVVEQRREREIVWKWAKRTFNPLTSKLGALVWLLLSAAVFAWLAKVIH